MVTSKTELSFRDSFDLQNVKRGVPVPLDHSNRTFNPIVVWQDTPLCPLCPYLIGGGAHNGRALFIRKLGKSAFLSNNAFLRPMLSNCRVARNRMTGLVLGFGIFFQLRLFSIYFCLNNKGLVMFFGGKVLLCI